MLGTAAARKADDELGDELHGVEVPPTALIGMISQAAGTPTFRATNLRTDMRETDLDTPFIELKVDILHLPGIIDSQKAGIMGSKCVHADTLRHQ